jgi:hypothetical protein
MHVLYFLLKKLMEPRSCAGPVRSGPVCAGRCRLVPVPVPVPVVPGADQCRPVPVPLTDRKKRCTVFLLILERDRDRRIQKRPHKDHLQCDPFSLRPPLSILVRTLLDATVTVTLQNQKKHCT